MIGWIKLHRKLKSWQWYDDHNATRLLVHLIISVNYESKMWKGELIEAGSMAYSWETLSKAVGMSVQETRTAMKKLKNSKEATTKSTNRFQVVSLIKWEEMQNESEASTSKLTNNQQTDNKQSTTTKEVKKKTIQERLEEFKNSLIPFLEKYSEEMIKDFFEYWTEHGEKDKKVRFEKQKSFGLSRRLSTWSRNEQKFNQNGNTETSRWDRISKF